MKICENTEERPWEDLWEQREGFQGTDEDMRQHRGASKGGSGEWREGSEGREEDPERTKRCI